MKKTLPIIIFSLLAGYYIGLHIYSEERPVIDNSGNKLDYVMNLVQTEYVDETNADSLIEKSIPKILEQLDPHSSYIPRDMFEEVNSDLAGSFSGIGIRFTIQDDTININDVIRQGPSAEAGLLSGDMIVTVNDTLFVGKGVCTNDVAMKKLKGPKGSFVKVGIKRFGEKELLHFNIRRDDILVESIETAYMIDGKWGYIQVELFGENTFAEFITKTIGLCYSNAQGLIIDLRGNGGGYLEIAHAMANQFLDKGKMIVYTEGKNSPKKVYEADGTGLFLNYPVIILVDETSASASEILAGAIQDNDRGTVIGRRTFGKGLVQEQMMLPDSSAIRLTTARYHTPSGRCIQKPYASGDNEKYAMDILDRYNRGEFFSADSIEFDTEHIYYTNGGRTVYGGGGIMPDIFVPSDTVSLTPYAKAIVQNGVILQFALQYSKANRHRFGNHSTHETLVSELKKEPLLDEFVAFASTKGIKPQPEQIAESREVLEDAIYSNLVYMLLSTSEHVKYINLDDPIVLKAVEVLENGEAYPLF